MADTPENNQYLDVFGEVVKSDDIARDILATDIDTVLALCPEPKRILVETKDGRIAAVILPYSMFDLAQETITQPDIQESLLMGEAALAAGITRQASEVFRDPEE